MNKLYKLIFQKRIKKQEALVSALDGFIQQIYYGDDLKLDESKRNLEEGLIEITKYGTHSSNGILITEDGYFLTTNHCVNHGLLGLDIISHDGRTYSIEKVCEQDEAEDVALAKANISGNCNPKKYRIFNTKKFEKVPIAIMTKRDGKLITTYGMINRGWHGNGTRLDNGKVVYYPNHFELYLTTTKRGDSGGSVLSPDGRLIGILSRGSEKYQISSLITIIKALELVDLHKRKIQEKIK